MTPEESAAYSLAKETILRAEREWWKYLNLGPYLYGDGELRNDVQALANLTTLPPDISRLIRCTHLELRGTKIADLSALSQLAQLEDVQFEGIPACEAEPQLAEISRIVAPKARATALIRWLEENSPHEPPDPIPEGPDFLVPDVPPIRLIDAAMDSGNDPDQQLLLDECRSKAEALHQVSDLAGNTAPRLPGAIDRYSDLIHKKPSHIGARAIWSYANTLESVWEVHQRAVADSRANDELPSSVAACLNDLLQTHRVWYLGHPGAREVEARASTHRRRENAGARRQAAIGVVEAAETSGVVATEATAPARANIETATLDTPAGIAALGELEDWAWNLIASTSRKLWKLAQEPPGGFITSSVGGYYLVSFIVTNEAALRLFATEFMTHGPIWWDAILAIARRSSASLPSDHQ